jgi:hypothetical protein
MRRLSWTIDLVGRSSSLINAMRFATRARISMNGTGTNRPIVKHSERESPHRAWSQPMHGAVLEEFEKHPRETIRGEHTLQELADVNEKTVDLADVFGYGPSAPGWLEPQS